MGGEAARIAEAYYDSADADAFYRLIWGGEDIHVGLYEGPEDTIRDASRRTVAAMAERLPALGPEHRVLDLGAGFGGAARYLARRFGCRVTCLNLSQVENAHNEALTAEAGLQDRVRVVHGSFDAIPEPDASHDVVWSQDAFLHAPDRARVLGEAARVLKPGGRLIFTDPMQADDVTDRSALAPILARIHLESLGSVAFYRGAAARLGLRERGVELMTHQLRTHYARVRSELEARAEELRGEVSDDYVARMLAGLAHWVEGADAGLLAWGVLAFDKPAP